MAGSLVKYLNSFSCICLKSCLVHFSGMSNAQTNGSYFCADNKGHFVQDWAIQFHYTCDWKFLNRPLKKYDIIFVWHLTTCLLIKPFSLEWYIIDDIVMWIQCSGTQRRWDRRTSFSHNSVQLYEAIDYPYILIAEFRKGHSMESTNL